MELFIIILLVCASITGLTFIVERGLALRWKKVIPPELEQAIENYNPGEDAERLRQLCRHHFSPLSRLLVLAQQHAHWPREENVDSLETHARHEVVQLERGLVVLEIIVGIAPLLGLVGTIYGLILLFGGLGAAGLAENNTVAKGIALALNATLMGLLTAIPSLIAYSYYNKKIESLSAEMETLCDIFLRKNYRHEEPAGKTRHQA